MKLTIQIPADYQEILISMLLDLDFEGFEQFDDRLEAFITKARFNDVSREQIEQLLAAWPVDSYIETEEIGQLNWNEVWEKTIEPQSIGWFLVKPTWSSANPGKGEILLEIDPKMAFGTGYHQSTRLMLELLPEMEPEDKHVLDAGTGSGILAIAAAKLGAASVFGFDIDKWSKQNATENVLLNKVDAQVSIGWGGMEIVPEGKKYDLILANINRNAIFGLLPEFSGRLVCGGMLAVSGILKTDKQTISQKARSYDLTPEQGLIKDEWICLGFKKSC